MSDIKKISSSYFTHKILMEDDYKSVIQPQRHLNPKVQDVVKNEIVKLLDLGLIYPISDSLWVSPIHVVPKKGGMTVVLNDNNELILSRTATRWMLARYEETNLVLNWGKCHFMVKEGIVLGHKISRAGIELLKKDAKFDFFDDCEKAFNILKEKTNTAPIIISPDWNVPFELMCDASDFAVGAVLGQRIDGKFKLIYYASKTLNNAQEHCTTTKKELLAVVFSFDKFRPYLILSKTIVYTDHSALKYLFSKQDAKPRLIRLENPDLGTFMEEEITDKFPDEHLMILKTKLNEDEPWGHHSASITGRKVYESGFFCPSIFKDAKDYVTRCDSYQRSRNKSSRTVAKNRFMELNELMELRDGAYANTRIYKERTKRWHDSRLRGDKNFKVGDKALAEKKSTILVKYLQSGNLEVLES
ncbi:reverse transcriptase domain-containing protein [Tanacetum coccineum]